MTIELEGWLQLRLGLCYYQFSIYTKSLHVNAHMTINASLSLHEVTEMSLD